MAEHYTLKTVRVNQQKLQAVKNLIHASKDLSQEDYYKVADIALGMCRKLFTCVYVGYDYDDVPSIIQLEQWQEEQEDTSDINNMCYYAQENGNVDAYIWDDGPQASIQYGPDDGSELMFVIGHGKVDRSHPFTFYTYTIQHWCNGVEGTTEHDVSQDKVKAVLGRLHGRLESLEGKFKG